MCKVKACTDLCEFTIRRNVHRTGNELVLYSRIYFLTTYNYLKMTNDFTLSFSYIFKKNVYSGGEIPEYLNLSKNCEVPKLSVLNYM